MNRTLVCADKLSKNRHVSSRWLMDCKKGLNTCRTHSHAISSLTYAFFCPNTTTLLSYCRVSAFGILCPMPLNTIPAFGCSPRLGMNLQQS